MFNYNYNTLHDSALEWQLADTNAFGQYMLNSSVSGSAFVKNQLVFSTPVFEMLGGSLTQTFVLDDALYFTNTGHKPSTVNIDFGDGQGYQSLSWGQEVTVTYTSFGTKTIKISFVDAGGQTVYAQGDFMKIWWTMEPGRLPWLTSFLPTN